MRNAESATDNGQLTTNHARFQIRLPAVAEEPRLHRCGRAHARARHRSKFDSSRAITHVTLTNKYEHKIEKEFQVSTGGKLIVQADQGSIEVNSDARDKVHVRLFRHVKGGSQAQADELFGNHDVTFTQDGNNVSIIGRNKKDRFRFGSIRQPSLQVRYEISIPKRFDVDLNTSGGDIRLRELEGAATARTSSGSIELGMIAGQVKSCNSA